MLDAYLQINALQMGVNPFYPMMREQTGADEITQKQFEDMQTYLNEWATGYDPYSMLRLGYY